MKFAIYRSSDKDMKDHPVPGLENVVVDEAMSQEYIWDIEYDDGCRIFTIEVKSLNELLTLIGKCGTVVIHPRLDVWQVTASADVPLPAIEIYDGWRE